MGSRDTSPGALALAAALTALLGACAAPKAQAPAGRYQPYQVAPQRVARDDHEPRGHGALRTAETLETLCAAQIRIDGSLIRFTVEQRSGRARVKKSGPMTEESHRRWATFLTAVDRFLGQPARLTVPLDVIRARVALDAETDLDREHYEYFPASLTAAVRARAMGLDRRLSQVRHLATRAKPKPTRLVWPIDPVVITSLFGTRSDPFEHEERFHRGLDLRAPVGKLIQTAAPGVVTRAGRHGGHGLHVEVLHDDNLVTRYSHLSLILVEEGMGVPARGPLGLAGNTGRSTGPHLHFEVIRDGKPVDPLSELGEPAFRDFQSGNIGAGD